jgi:nicotinate phosphoribosyltransferase
MTTPGSLSPLFTDLYELTMAAGYFDHGFAAEATFSMFIRGGKTPRRCYVAAGLAPALQELAGLRFSAEDLRYLDSTGLFSQKFLSHMEGFRFTGEVLAMPEGTVFFPDEPVLEVTAPVIEAQLVETLLLNTIGFSTLIASKAIRCVQAAGGRSLVDFALRRTQGSDAGMKVARSAYIAGFAGTSNVLAGKLYGIPISGTMAHSYVCAFESEEAAFEAFSQTFPNDSVFLIDTYDTLEGARAAVRAAAKMARRGASLKGVRLDSGDMVDMSRQVRRILDEAGLSEVKVLASSSFDEYLIRDVLAKGAAIDAFGIGTKMGVSADAPYLDIVYKLVHLGDRPIRKLSPGKVTLAGRKQVFRKMNSRGRCEEDVIGLRDETQPDGMSLLERVMTDGRPTMPPPDLDALRVRCRDNLAAFEATHVALEGGAPYPVRVSERLAALQKNI